MELIRTFGREDLARVYVLRLRKGEGFLVECVESLQPPRPRSEKWVLIVSTLFGCPVRCQMCDAGGWYKGRLTEEEILDQIRFMVGNRFGGRRIPVGKFKIQFSRMGEPALNPALIGLLERLPREFEAPGLLPSISSMGPAGAEPFFERLIVVKDRLYGKGRFQLQFSIHTTDPEARAALMPVRGLDYSWIGDYGRRFRKPGDQQITLNFAAIQDMPVDPDRLRDFFDPETFLVKLTPLNPTARAGRAHFASGIDPCRPETGKPMAARFERAGYRVLLSIGEVEENFIGSNCGQYVSREWAAGAGTLQGDPPHPSA